MEGIKVRVTAKAPDERAAARLLDAEEAELRALLGTTVFGVDDESMESVIGQLLLEAGLTLAVAESLTGGLLGARITSVPGASSWVLGGIISYDSEVKHRLLDVAEGPVVSQSAAIEMAGGAAKMFGADVGLGVTGVAGPTEQEGQPVGTIWMALVMGDSVEAQELRLPGSRQHVREMATISLLDLLRRRLVARRS
jgi:nicotinamide-nucleotide amidase